MTDKLGDYIARVKQLNSGSAKRAFVMTFGCQQNEADSERIRGMARDMGYDTVDTYVGADLIVVNTCAIREHAEMKALSMLGSFKAEKRTRPDTVIAVVGCMVAEEHVVNLIKQDFHYVDFTLEPSMLHRFPELLYLRLAGEGRRFIYGEGSGSVVEGIPCERSSKHKAWVSIMYGCNNFCSYCIVPYTRGRERSRCLSEIISECKELIASGVKEITLLGQNVNSYRGEVDFAGLLEKIAELDGDFIIRFMTSHPKDVSPELVKVMERHTDKIAPYFHLPLQSGSNKILKSMNRTYTRERFLEIAESLRAAIPDICLSTDVIIGFPGESDKDFEDTLDILRRVNFDLVYSFKFSPRKGTPAASMAGEIPPATVDERMERLLRIQDEISQNMNLPYVGTRRRVLVDSVAKRGEGVYAARTATNKLVHFKSESCRIGEFIDVEIEKAGPFILFGKEIEN